MADHLCCVECHPSCWPAALQSLEPANELHGGVRFPDHPWNILVYLNGVVQLPPDFGVQEWQAGSNGWVYGPILEPAENGHGFRLVRCPNHERQYSYDPDGRRWELYRDAGAIRYGKVEARLQPERTDG